MLGAVVVVAGSAVGGVGALTAVVVSKPGPTLPGDVEAGAASRTDTLIGPSSVLDESLIGQSISLDQITGP